MQTDSRKNEFMGLMECLRGIEDPRVERTSDHRLIDILVIGVCCLLCGGQGFTDMETFGKAQFQWLRGFLALPGGIPSHDTFNRVFSAISPDAFLDCFLRWTRTLRTALGCEIVALDGKALRRAHGKRDAVPYIVSAWAATNGLTLGQVKVDEKSNEITAIPKLLRILELNGCLVTIDAMGCQKKIAREIVKAGADYVLALKGNPSLAHDEVRAFFDELVPPDPAMGPPPAPARTAFHQTVDGGHGRVETRRYWITDWTEWFADRGKWKELKGFGMVESLREGADGTRSYERRCFLASITPDAARFAAACRGHWGVENPLHWTLDVTFREDDSRARTGFAAENLAALRRLALNTLKADMSQPKLSIRSKRVMAAWNGDYLKRLLGSV